MSSAFPCLFGWRWWRFWQLAFRNFELDELAIDKPKRYYTQVQIILLKLVYIVYPFDNK